MAKKNEEIRGKVGEFLPMGVSTFDNLISAGGIERGNTVLVSGGCGSGKTIFAVQSIYNAALKGEKSVYFTLEEKPDKIRRHMKKNFNWDIESLEKKGLLYLKKIDPFELARDVELTLKDVEKTGKLPLEVALTKPPEISLIDKKKIEVPFHPDRIVIDSISSLSSAFIDRNIYRVCIQVLVESLNSHNSVNILTSETEQEQMKYSRTGTEEFLVDGVVALYSVRKSQLRRRAMEIVKLRCSDHVKEVVLFRITRDGIVLSRGEKLN